MRHWFALVSLALGVSVLSSPAQAGLEGTYVLDKATLGKRLKAQFAKLPDDRKAFVALAKGMFASMTMTLKLQPKGVARTHSRMKVFGRPRIYKGKGTWKVDGNTLTITTTVTTKKKKSFPQTIACQVTKAGLNCRNASRKGTGPLPFLRHPNTKKGAMLPAARNAAPAKRPAAPTKRPAAAPADGRAAPPVDRRAAAPADRRK